MPSTATTRNRFEKQGTGENTNTWGTKLNTTGLDRIDEAMDGRAAYTLSGPKTLTSTNFAADEARMRIQDITGGTGGTVTIPSVEKFYIVRNGASGDAIFTTGGGTTATIPPGKTYTIISDGTNVRVDDNISAAATSATNAAASANAAQTARTGAETARTGAETAATSAGNSAASAATSATNAANSATAAAASAASVNASNLVQKTGNETIGGIKTFTNGVSINGQLLDGLTAAGLALAEAATHAAQKTLLGLDSVGVPASFDAVGSQVVAATNTQAQGAVIAPGATVAGSTLVRDGTLSAFNDSASLSGYGFGSNYVSAVNAGAATSLGLSGTWRSLSYTNRGSAAPYLPLNLWQRIA
jgi:hypothetical protein